ncbi:MAG: hypothetical protein DDT31_02007 [Syntrophomonadaceae bacterium]|nr:hypothetical protein [Bacillota bacterium]
MYYVYVFKLRDGSFYTGYTTNLKERVKKHNEGGVISTKHKKPGHLLWYCAFEDEKKAIKFEKYLKTASGIAMRNKHLI